MEPGLRAATAADATGIRALMAGERVNPFGVDWRNFVVAACDGDVVACAQLRLAGAGRVELGSLVVRADLRGAGLGRRVAAAALDGAAGRRVLVVTAATRAPLFAGLGFRPLSPARAGGRVFANWLVGQAGSAVALARGLRPRRLVVMERR